MNEPASDEVWLKQYLEFERILDDRRAKLIDWACRPECPPRYFPLVAGGLLTVSPRVPTLAYLLADADL